MTNLGALMTLRNLGCPLETPLNMVLARTISFPRARLPTGHVCLNMIDA